MEKQKLSKSLGGIAKSFRSLKKSSTTNNMELGLGNPVIGVDYLNTTTDYLTSKPLPFSAHPHMGFTVITIPIKGQTIKPWDNKSGWYNKNVIPGGIYLVDCGNGIIHDERK